MILSIIGIISPFLSFSQNLDTTYIDSRLHDYLFQNGSYWVYENEVTKEIDSLVIIDVIHDFNPEVWMHGSPVIGAVEYYQMYYESKTLDYQTWDQLIGYAIVREGINWGNNGQYIFLSSYQIGDSSAGAKIVNIYDNYSIGDIIFSDVTVMYIDSNIIESNKPVNYYYSRGIGIVRKEILNPDTSQILEAWNLTNWNIDQILSRIQNSISILELTIYPNPFDESTTLMYNNPESNTFTLYIMDLSGKVCRIDNKIMTSKYVLERKDLENGIYFLELRGPRTYRGKIIVE